MKIAFITLIILISYTNSVFAACLDSGGCFQEMQYLAQNVPSGSISSIQSQFGGRVIGTQDLGNGSTQIQILKPDNKVIIVTVDSSGNIINVQE